MKPGNLYAMQKAQRDPSQDLTTGDNGQLEENDSATNAQGTLIISAGSRAAPGGSFSGSGSRFRSRHLGFGQSAAKTSLILRSVKL